MSVSPFLCDEFRIRWSELTPERVGPDMLRGLAEARAAIAELEAPPLAELTYANTLQAFEQATERLARGWGWVEHLLNVADSPALRAAHAEVLDEVTDFFTGLPLNAALWRRLCAFAATAEARALTGARRRFLEETLAEFRLNGAELPPGPKARLQALQSELAAVTQSYAQNCIDARNAWELVVTDPARLAGLPPSAQVFLRQAAAARGHGSDAAPAWRLTLQAPCVVAVLTYAEDPALRRQLWEASVAIGTLAPWDNAPLLRRILALRREKALLLGKPHFPDLVTERRMAKSGAAALAFVEGLKARLGPHFERDCAELEAFKAARTGTPSGPLDPWEIGFWAEKLRQERYSFDQEELRPYFALPRVLAGLFEIARRLFGVEIRARAGVEAWHPDVCFYDVHEVAGGRHLGSFYADWHPRETKSGGAWMDQLITGGPREAGRFAPHLGLVAGNLTPPAGGRPAFLSHDEVTTVFHEFGHLLHQLCGEVEVPTLNGAQVAWDFIELPSQIMENWCWERASLDLFARHHETGAPIPDALLERVRAARNFRAAADGMRQLVFAKTDLEIHLRDPAFVEGDFDAALRALLAGWLPRTSQPVPSLLRNFSHLFADPDGYAAGYYSYKWAEVLDADAFTRFQREGILNPETGAAFRRAVLSRGNSADPASLFREFMGRDPDPEALLVRSGLAA